MDTVLPSFRFWLMSWFIDTETYDPAYKFLGGALAMQGYTIGPQVVDNTDASRALYAEGQIWVHEGSEELGQLGNGDPNLKMKKAQRSQDRRAL
jgi:hypothetical protein